MLALAVLGLLAVASPADTAARVPGTTFRFAQAESVLAARGFTPTGPGVRKGPCRFFGLAAGATLTFADGRLARAEFAVSDASPSAIAYVHDQLAAMGYRRSCGKPTPKTEVCDWTGRTHVHVEVDGANLTAAVVPAHRAPVAPADRGDAAAAQAGTTVPVLPETLAVAVPGRVSRHAPATLLGEPRCGYPAAARQAGVQGRVWVLALVDTDGRVLRAQVESGTPVLHDAALACVKGWSFQPVAWQGAPCRFQVLVPVTFTAH